MRRAWRVGWRLCLGWLASLSLALAAPGDVEAARLQVEVWLDAGEAARAVALSRRAVAQHPDDVRWHLTRLRALHAAGLRPWIEASYGTSSGREAAQAAYAMWRVEVGEALDLPAHVTMAPADLFRATIALKRGDAAPARAVGWAGTTVEHLALRIAWSAHARDQATLLDTLRQWPEEDDVSVLGLAPLWTWENPRAPVKKALEATRTKLLGRVAQTADPLGLFQVARLGLAVRDKALVKACFDRLDALGLASNDRQAELDGFLGGPAAWTAWQLPPRPRWGEAMLDAVGLALSRHAHPKVPWGRGDEVTRMAVSTAEQLQRRGRVLEADALLARHLGPCASSIAPELAVATERRREGREAAESALIRCVGGTDFYPRRDVAGLDVARRAEDVAAAWFAFGRVADLGGWFDDAALAYGLAARIGPTELRVAVARQRARAVGMATDHTGVPDVATLTDGMARAVWLHPRAAVARSRARLARARTLAWLEPTAANLDAARVPLRSCLLTLQPACQLQLAVVGEARRRAGLAAGEVATDRGALDAAASVLDARLADAFHRSASVARIAADLSGRAVDVEAMLAQTSTVALGRPAPAWATGGVRSDDLRGKVVVLSFWASWCKPCIAEWPLLDALGERWRRAGIDVRVVAPSADTREGSYRRALARLNWTAMHVVRDPGLRTTFDVDTLPTILVIDGDGVLRARRVGYEGGDLAWLDEAVRTWAAVSSDAQER